MTLQLRLLSARLAMLQYALTHIAQDDDIILIGEHHAQTDMVQAIRMRDHIEPVTCTINPIERDYNQKHNRKTGAAQHRRQAKRRRNRK